MLFVATDVRDQFKNRLAAVTRVWNGTARVPVRSFGR